MTAHKYVVAIAGEDLEPSSYMTNTLCFNHTVPGIILPQDLEDLAQQIGESYRDHWLSDSAAREIRVKVYNYGAPPQYPLAEHVVNEDSKANLNCPGEVALCLSFYNDHPRPRARGRVYLPMGPKTGSVGANPGTSRMSAAIAQAQAFGAAGGVNVDWSVFSTRDNVARKVTDVWCDDEWDTMRSRGITAKAARATWHTSE